MLVAPRKRRREINYQPRSIYALSSGMMSEGTTSNRFAMRFLDNPRNAVAFVGYTDPTTPGWRLRNAKPGDMIELDSKMPIVANNLAYAPNHSGAILLSGSTGVRMSANGSLIRAR